MEDNLLWQFNLNNRHVTKHFAGCGFWYYVLKAWSIFNFQVPQNHQNIGPQLVWFNSNITSNMDIIQPLPGFPVNLKIENLMHDNIFMSHQAFQDAHNCRVNWLHYGTLIDAIPTHWKIVLNHRSNLNDEYEDRFNQIIKCNKASAMIYHSVNRDESQLLISASFWKQNLSNFDVNKHRKAFRNLYKVTNVTKLRNFQYRLLYNKIFCNNRLFHWKKSRTQYCDLCNDKQNKQDMLHLLYCCKYSRSIWTGLEKMFIDANEEIDLTMSNVIYNRVHAKSAHIINFIVLLTKFTIFRNKCRNLCTTITDVRNEIKLYHDIEFYIATKNDKITKFEKKWALYQKY